MNIGKITLLVKGFPNPIEILTDHLSLDDFLDNYLVGDDIRLKGRTFQVQLREVVVAKYTQLPADSADALG